MPPERRKPNNSAAAITPTIEPRAKQAGDQAVEAIAGGKAVLEYVLVAEQHEAAGKSAERAGNRKREHHHALIGNAGAVGGNRIEADRAELHAKQGLAQHDRGYDCDNYRDRQTDVHGEGIIAGQKRELGRFRNFQRLRQRRRTGHRLAQQSRRLHAPIHEPDRDERQQQRADDFVGADLDFQDAGNRAPEHARHCSGKQRNDERQPDRQAGDAAVKRDCGRGDAADRDLTLAADIHQIGAVGDDEADTDQRKGNAAVDRRGNGIRRADGAVDKGRQRVRHRNADGEDQSKSEQARDHHGGDGNHHRRPQPCADVSLGAHGRVGHCACPAIIAPIRSRSLGSAAQLPMIRPR